MHHADIKAALEKRGYSLSYVANLEGVTRSFVSQVVRGASGARIAYRIAALLEMPIDKLWPGRYNAPPRDKWRDRGHERRAA